MRIVIRIGGSVIASPVNAALIRSYSNLLLTLKKKGHQIIVVVGGGKLARDFIETAKHLELTQNSQDDLAISVSRLNAQLILKTLGSFGCECVPATIDEALKCLNSGKIAIMGGLKPGMTTDAVAALLAWQIDSDLLVKATDQEGIYDKDPKNHSDAVKLDFVGYEQISQIFEQAKHQAGIHQILDPKAVKILKKNHLKVIVVNGFKSENVMAAIEGKHIGTVIE